MPKRKEIDSSGADVLTDKRNIDVVTAELNALYEQAERQVLSFAIEMGRRLCEAKNMVEHGEWGDYLKNKTRFSVSSANNLMRVFREYGDEQGSLFGATAKSQTLGNLSYSKAIALLAVPESDRESFAEEVGASELSTRELEQAVRERKEALEAKDAAEQQAEEQRRTAQEAIDRADKAAADAKRAEDEKAELERQLEEIRNASPDQQALDDALDAVRKETAAEAKKEVEEKLKKKIARADEDKAKAEAAQVAAEQERDHILQEQAAMSGRIKHLEKQVVAASSQTVAVFKAHFENAQDLLNKMLTCITDSDDDTRTKLSTALRAMCETVLEKV